MNKEDWRVITRRPMTEEERKELSGELGYDVEYDEAFLYGNLPEDGEEVIITTTEGYVLADCFDNDCDGICFNSHDMDDVIAWMPMPKPYKEEVQE